MERITLASTISALVGGTLLIGYTTLHLMSDAAGLALALMFMGIYVIIGSIFFTQKFRTMEDIALRIDRQEILGTDEAVEGVPFAGVGTIECDQPLTSPYTSQSCMYYHSIREQYTGGKNAHWRIDENLTSFAPFYIRDKAGRLRVDLTNMDDDFSEYKLEKGTRIYDPQNSEVDCDKVLDKQEYTEEEGSGIKLFFIGPELKYTYQYRKSEFVLVPNTDVFVFGMIRKKDSELVLEEAEGFPLIITRKNKEKYLEDFSRGDSLVYLVHMLVAFGFTIAIFSANYFFNLSGILLTLPLAIGNILIFGSVGFSLYNRFIKLDQNTRNALSNIDIELKRRADLIPNIVEMVKKYAKYEKETNQILVEARKEIMFTEQPISRESAAIGSLIASIENYPELKADQHFRKLMLELTDTEERIAQSREFYNRTVRKYNTLREQFPFLLISLPLGFKKKEYVTLSSM